MPIPAGFKHSLALKSDGSVIAWGYNPEGQSTVPAGLAGVRSIGAGDPTGWWETRTLSGFSGTVITDVNVTLSIKTNSGWNGDLYAYLAHTGGLSMLLNRPGKSQFNPMGYSDEGFSAVFDDGAINTDSHLNFTDFANATGQAWSPDARSTDPSTVLDTDPRSAAHMLSAFNGLSPDGEWTLFIADMSGGGAGPQLGVGPRVPVYAESYIDAWGVTVTYEPIPEPANLPVAALALGAVHLLHRRRRSAALLPS